MTNRIHLLIGFIAVTLALVVGWYCGDRYGPDKKFVTVLETRGFEAIVHPMISFGGKDGPPVIIRGMDFYGGELWEEMANQGKLPPRCRNVRDSKAGCIDWRNPGETDDDWSKVIDLR